MWQNVAFTLIGIGILVLIGWAVKGFFLDSGIHILIRVAVGLVGAGVLILLGVAVRDRIKKSKEEDFKGVSQ
jgi:hypothetical protein